ncbi:MAG: hypothetical protein K0S08_1086 [Gammaproteobacteria bacterium]|nr:hypothetical protein [Gammaproteobacteria bacterium]
MNYKNNVLDLLEREARSIYIQNLVCDILCWTVCFPIACLAALPCGSRCGDPEETKRRNLIQRINEDEAITDSDIDDMLKGAGLSEIITKARAQTFSSAINVSSRSALFTSQVPISYGATATAVEGQTLQGNDYSCQIG